MGSPVRELLVRPLLVPGSRCWVLVVRDILALVPVLGRLVV